MILDPFGGDVGETYTHLLSKWKGAIYLTLAPPLLSKTDELGVGLGLLSSGQSLTSSAIQQVQLQWNPMPVQWCTKGLVILEKNNHNYHYNGVRIINKKTKRIKRLYQLC